METPVNLTHRTHRVRSFLILAAVLVGLGLPLILPGCGLTGNRLARSHTPRDCAECHVDTTRQWADSAHAAAWSNAAFIETSQQRSMPECLPCHAPTPMLEQSSGSRPVLRNDRDEDGVDCHACHAIGRDYAGPYLTWGPHRTERDRARLPCSSFCGRCHLVEMEEYETLYVASLEPTERPKQCRECHMPQRIQRLTQGHLLSLAHPKRVTHDHRFPLWTEEITRDAVEMTDLAVRRQSDGELAIDVTLVNRGAGHRIPTGEYGHREVRILVEVLDQNEDVLNDDEWPLMARYPDALSPGKASKFPFDITLPLDAEPHRVRVTVERVNSDRSFRYVLASGERSIAENNND